MTIYRRILTGAALLAFSTAGMQMLAQEAGSAQTDGVTKTAPVEEKPDPL
jgi:hypothetical protein